MQNKTFLFLFLQNEKECFNVTSVWLQRGQEHIFGLDEDWNIDAEYHDFKKLDPLNKPEDKLFIENVINYKNVDKIEGKKIASGIPFK